MTAEHTHLPKYNIGVHFLTAKTFRNTPYFGDARCALVFCEELEAARQRYGFHVLAFVVMPDHVHLLLWWDTEARPDLTISKIAWAVKGLSARRIVDYLKDQNRVGGASGGGIGEGNALAYPLRPARKPEAKPHRRNWRYRIWQPGTSRPERYPRGIPMVERRILCRPHRKTSGYHNSHDRGSLKTRG